MASQIVTTIITFLLFLGAGAWIFVMAYWILGKFGIWKWATYRRLKRRYKDYEFENVIIEWCLEKIERKWRYKDVRRFSKYSLNQGEILYTFLMLSKMPKTELNGMIERRLNNGRQKTGRVKEEVGSTLPKYPDGS